VLYAALTLWLFRTFVFSDDLLYGSDTLSLGYMARKFYADALRSGVFPRWNPLILGGTPFLESLAGGDALYPTSLLLLVMEPYRALGWKLVLHVFLAGLFMFGWVRTLGCSRAAALVGGLAYGLAPFLVGFVSPGHDGKIFVISLAPLLFWTAERTLVRGGLLPFVWVALVIALVLLTTHFQMAYFLFGGVGVFYLFRVWQIWRGGKGSAAHGQGAPADGTLEPGGASATSTPPPAERRGGRAAAGRLALFLGAAVTGAAAAGVQLVPAVDYVVEYSRRTATTVSATAEDNVGYSSSFSLHPEELVSYVVPEFAGNRAGGAAWATETYWGRNFLKDNHEAAGVVVLLLAGLSFFGAPRRGLRLFLLSLGGVALLFALGRHTPVWRLFYEVVPGISLFRAPSQASFLFGFAAVTLAAFGVDRALAMASGEEDEDALARATRYLWIAAGLVALLMLLVASGALLSLWTSWVYRDMVDFQLAAFERARPFIVRGAVVSALFAAAAAGCVWAGRRGLLQPAGVLAVLTLLVALDALRVDGAFIRTMRDASGLDFRAWTSPDEGVSYLQQRQREGEPFRVAPLDTADHQDVTPAMFGLELATGHHPNDLARYRELIGMRASDPALNLLEGTTLAQDSGGTRIQPGPVLRLLNVRYVLVPGLLEGVEPVAQSRRIAQRPQAIFEVDALPRARLVADAVVVPDDQAVARILDPTFDVARSAVLAEEPPIQLPGGAATGEVRWLERGLNGMRLQVRSEGPALLVLADNWFPGWHARVDGRETPVLRAYHTLRAVPVGAGEQTVELYYESSVLRLSSMLSAAALALLLAAAAVSLLRSRARAAGLAEG
jgi:hypothetical protein